MQSKLLQWFDKNRRPMPWRLKRPDPYKTWVSEIMLQQTQVETVIPYFRKFLKIFPTVQDLAVAEIDQVLTLWSGLGYYSRARHLHRAAQTVVRDFAGRFPSTAEALQKLPGIGRYTAGAIASIAFDVRAPILDGNVIRVLTRLRGWSGDPKSKELNVRLWREAEAILPRRRIGDFNQALMELGSLVCKSDQPDCPACPLKKECEAHSLGRTGDFPTPSRKAKPVDVLLEASLIEKRGKFLIARRNGARHLQSLWEFPQIHPKEIGVRAKSRQTFPKIRHSIMNRRIQLTPVLYRFCAGRPLKTRSYVDYRWIAPEGLAALPTSSLNRKIGKLLGTPFFHLPPLFPVFMKREGKNFPTLKCPKNPSAEKSRRPATGRKPALAS